MILGFDVGGTNARCLLVDPDRGAILDRSRTSSGGDGERLVQAMADIARELAHRNDATITAAGIGIAGLVNRQGVVRYSPNLPDLVEFPIRSAMYEALGIPISVSNDATTGTLAESRFGAGRGSRDFVFVALGTGIGTGFVVDGRLVVGANGFAGEAGHMVVQSDGPTHITGQQGPWEYFASGNALGRMGREAAAAGRFDRGVDVAGSGPAITGVDVAAALAEGDSDAAVIVDGFCREVARGIANLCLVLDPDLVVIGGGLTAMGEPLRNGVDRWLAELLLGSAHRPRVEVRLAELGSDAGALGAALLAATSAST